MAFLCAVHLCRNGLFLGVGEPRVIHHSPPRKYGLGASKVAICAPLRELRFGPAAASVPWRSLLWLSWPCRRHSCLWFPAANAADPCAPGGNPIVCENSKPGTSPQVWDIDGAGDPSIQGFATKMSVDTGTRVDFKVKTNARAYKIDIYRTGWYQGLGARKIATVAPSVALPQTPAGVRLGRRPPSWSTAAAGPSRPAWDVPATAVSGCTSRC